LGPKAAVGSCPLGLRLAGLLRQVKHRAKHLSWAWRTRLYQRSLKLRWKNQLAASLLMSWRWWSVFAYLYPSLQHFTCGWKQSELLLVPILSPGASLGPSGQAGLRWASAWGRGGNN